MKYKIFAVFVLLLLSIYLYPACLLADPIYAGASATKITPDLNIHKPIYIAGFGMNRKATGVHDDLWSRCICLRIGGTTVAIVSVDLIGIMYPEYLSILERLPGNMDVKLVLLTSTHNHEGPDVIGIWGPYVLSGINWEWYNEAMDKIAGGIVQAYRAMEPAGLKFGHGEAAGFSRDSREPIIMEEQVETIQAVNLGGETVATMVFFASHPEVLWDQNTLLTSDYPNYLYQYVEANVGGTAVFISGPLGGLITPIVENHDFDDAQKFGEAVADIALTSLQNEPVIWETQLRAEIREIFVPLTNPVFRAAALIGMLERPLYHMRKDVLSAVSVMEFGENGNLAQIVTVPGEDFPENWFEIKSKLHAEHRIHIGLCMDELGYIVPIEEFNWKNYEESMSASRFMDPIVHKNLEDMLKIIK